MRRTREALERGTLDPELIAEFDRTIRAHRSRIFATCRRVVRNPERAEELTQEALTVALSKLGEFRGSSSLSTWLCGIAKHLAFNAIRRRGELLLEDQVLVANQTEDRQAVSALRELSRQEREHVLSTAAKACLNPEDQEVLYLRFVENLPYETIEDLLELGPGQARVALQRIKRRLKPELLRRLDELGHGKSFFARTTDGRWSP